MITANSFLQNVLLKEIGSDTVLKEVSPRTGGCISNAASVKTNIGSYFVKWGQSDDMYRKERDGLFRLNGNSDLKIPTVIGSGITDGLAYIIMEHIQVFPATGDYWENLGKGLAQLHKNTASNHGSEQHNYIGSLYQQNDFEKLWTDFFIKNRLEVQLRLALHNQYIDASFSREFRRIYKVIKAVIPDSEPSLLHGDLWSGNILPTSNASAAVIDPAIYYGSREIEIAFTYLFGGFDDKFYQSYAEFFPLEPDFKDRIELYNLYPLMVHLNMFGSAYLGDIRNTIGKYV